jgi:DNA polymerase I-like protein with 3'-5' exonuclease and polymerase domains
MRNSCVYKPAGTDTFRLSSTKLFGRWGSNLQNVEKSVRKIYVPDPGMVFVQVDQSGAEALIVAYCGVAGKYRTLFENNVKPHTYMALNLFKEVWPRKMMEHRLISSMDEFDIDEIINTAIADLKNHPHWKNLASLIKDSDDWSLTERYYYLAKQTEHSSNYDIQPPTFRMNILEKSGGKIVISKEDAERFLGVKHALFPEIKQSYHRYVQRCVTTSMCLYNLHGHPLQITDHTVEEKDWKEHYARIPQSTVGEITNVAFARMQSYIQEENKRWDLLANTHDSYMLQCPTGESQECATMASQFMEQEFTSPIDGVKFKMRSEAQVGRNWAPAKAGNPEGLKTIKV